MSEEDLLWKEFPSDLSVWELCVKEHEKTKRKAELWEDLKFILQKGKWEDRLTINQVLNTMSNIDDELKDSIPSTPLILHSTEITYQGKAQRCPICNGTGQVDSGFIIKPREL